MKHLLYRRIPAWMLCVLLLSGVFMVPAAAADWPEGVSIAAEGGILMDADSGTILYGKNIHTAFYPASITKILTALIVIENCGLDETVTFSHEAVFGVEPGSSSAALDVGDQLPVRDCLYAMLLKSANEAANALAEHTAGSISQFADMMNEKAKALGCMDSYFNNPSGLNDPNHYTSAHDMALIAQAAFSNETFVEIDSTLYYDLPVTLRNKEGLRIYPGHRMLKKNSSQYYPGIIGGKTGYTSIAGNTLVTCAQRGDMRLIAVVLNGRQTHYSDTRKLLDYGFRNFKSVKAEDIDTTYASVENDMMIAGLPTTDLSVLQLQGAQKLTLPVQADYSQVVSSISYKLKETALKNAVAEISYHYGDHAIGSAYLMLNQEGSAAEPEAVEVAASANMQKARTAAETEASAAEEVKNSPLHLDLPAIDIPPAFFVIAGILTAAAGMSVWFRNYRIRLKEREEEERLRLASRRQERLQDIGMTVSDFDSLMEQKRAAVPEGKPGKKRPKKHKSFLNRKGL